MDQAIALMFPKQWIVACASSRISCMWFEQRGRTDGPQDRRPPFLRLQTASSNLRQTNFKPFRHDVVLDPRAVANTPLDSRVWEDEDFEDAETKPEENPADRAIRALEEDRKKKEEGSKWMRWAEMQYPKPKPQATQSAAVTPRGSAVVTPASSAKKPPTPTTTTEKVRQEIDDLVRKEFFPGLPDSMLQKT